METQVNNELVSCIKQGKDVSPESCKRCEFFMQDDWYNLFHRCTLEEPVEALYKLYKKKPRVPIPA